MADDVTRTPDVGDHVTVGHGVREWFVEALTAGGLAVVVLLDGSEDYEATRMTASLSDLHKIEATS